MIYWNPVNNIILYWMPTTVTPAVYLTNNIFTTNVSNSTNMLSIHNDQTSTTPLLLAFTTSYTPIQNNNTNLLQLHNFNILTPTILANNVIYLGINKINIWQISVFKQLKIKLKTIFVTSDNIGLTTQLYYSTTLPITLPLSTSTQFIGNVDYKLLTITNLGQTFVNSAIINLNSITYPFYVFLLYNKWITTTAGNLKLINFSWNFSFF
jgi:hypothetical protein